MFSTFQEQRLDDNHILKDIYFMRTIPNCIKVQPCRILNMTLIKKNNIRKLVIIKLKAHIINNKITAVNNSAHAVTMVYRANFPLDFVQQINFDHNILKTFLKIFTTLTFYLKKC